MKKAVAPTTTVAINMRGSFPIFRSPSIRIERAESPFSSTAFEHYAPCAARLEETLGLGKECFDEYQNNYRKHPR